jgi:hypothetical protein
MDSVLILRLYESSLNSYRFEQNKFNQLKVLCVLWMNPVHDIPDARKLIARITNSYCSMRIKHFKRLAYVIFGTVSKGTKFYGVFCEISK